MLTGIQKSDSSRAKIGPLLLILLEFTDCCNYYLISIIGFIHYNECSLTDKQTFCYICQQQSILQRNAKSLTALWWTCWNTLRQPPVRNWNWLVKNDVKLASVHLLRLSSSHNIQETKSPFGSMIFAGILCISCTSGFCLCCPPNSFSSFPFCSAEDERGPKIHRWTCGAPAAFGVCSE